MLTLSQQVPTQFLRKKSEMQILHRHSKLEIQRKRFSNSIDRLQRIRTNATACSLQVVSLHGSEEL